MIIAISGYLGTGKDTFGKMLQYQVAKKNDNYFPKHWNELSLQEQEAKSGWQIKKFATKLKQILCLLTGCTMEQLEDQEFKASNMPKEWDKEYTVHEVYAIWQGFSEEEKSKWTTIDGLHYMKKYKLPMTYREALQQLGTEALRDKFHPDVHVNALFADYIPEPVSFAKDSNGIRFGIEKWSNWIITDPRFPSNEFKAIRERDGIILRLVNGQPRKSDHISEISIDTYNEYDEIIDNSGTLENLMEHAKRIVQKYNM